MSTLLRLNLTNLSIWNRLRICFMILFKGGFAIGGLKGGFAIGGLEGGPSVESKPEELLS